MRLNAKTADINRKFPAQLQPSPFFLKSEFRREIQEKQTRPSLFVTQLREYADPLTPNTRAQPQLDLSSAGYFRHHERALNE
jgi:hypothetical protein